jgi:hypothetical protein
MDVLEQFPVRKTKKQKMAFRAAVQSYAESLGYPVSVETGTFGACNLLLGDPEQAKFLVTAHYDTCAGMPIPNFITPCNLPMFLLHQLALIGVLAAIYLCAVNGFILIFEDHRFSALLALLCVAFLVLWMLIGPANKNNANDNTSGVVTLLEIARTFPENQRHKVCFVLFDLEEAGLIGSACYRKKHKEATDKQLVLNLDCVGEGDHLLMFPTKYLKENRKRLTSLYKACGYFGKKSLRVYEEGRYVYPSDQMHFPYGVGICALRKRKKLLYLSRIHTNKDTILEETNVNILRAALTTLICRDEVN